jgi:N utilization substance protein A
MDLEKDDVYKRYMDRVGDLVVGEVSQILKKEVLVLDDATQNEIVLPRLEMIKGRLLQKRRYGKRYHQESRNAQWYTYGDAF